MIALTTVTTSPVLVSLPTLSLTVSAAPASPQLKEFTRTEDTQAPGAHGRGGSAAPCHS